MTTTISKSSSQGKFLAEAEAQGWIVESDTSTSFGVSVTTVTLTDPAYVEPEADNREVVKALVARFDQDGRFYDGHTLLITNYGHRVSERKYNLTKFKEVVGRAQNGPKHQAERQARAEHQAATERERLAEAQGLLTAAADTEEIKRLKQSTASSLDYAERDLKDSLKAVIAEATEALEQIEAGHKTGQFHGTLFGRNIEKAVEAHHKRNAALDLKAHLVRLFGEQDTKVLW